MTAAISAGSPGADWGIGSDRPSRGRGSRPAPGDPGRGRLGQAAQSGPRGAGAVCGLSEWGSTWPPRSGRRGGAGVRGGGDASSRPSARSPASGARARPGGSAPRQRRREKEEGEEEEEGG